VIGRQEGISHSRRSQTSRRGTKIGTLESLSYSYQNRPVLTDKLGAGATSVVMRSALEGYADRHLHIGVEASSLCMWLYREMQTMRTADHFRRSQLHAGAALDDAHASYVDRRKRLQSRLRRRGDAGAEAETIGSRTPKCAVAMEPSPIHCTATPRAVTAAFKRTRNASPRAHNASATGAVNSCDNPA
jgi:hypothetical protein